MTNLIQQLDFRDWDENFPYVTPDLIYIDPPFNTGREFFDFNDSHLDYPKFLQELIEMAYNVISETGNFILHLDWHSAHIARIIGDKIFGSRNFQNEIIWKYNSGGASPKRLARKHDTLLWWTVSNDYAFNVLREPYPNDYGNRPGFHPEGKMLSDVWDIPRQSNTALDRTGWATEKPPKLMERIVTIFSNPNDLVVDFTCGSGTTGLAAKRLNRSFILTDISADAIDIARARLFCL